MRRHLIETPARPLAPYPRHRTRVFRRSRPRLREGRYREFGPTEHPGLPTLSPGHDHIGPPSAAAGSDKLLAPIEDAGIGVVPSSHLCRVRLDLMLARLAPDHQPHTCPRRLLRVEHRLGAGVAGLHSCENAVVEIEIAAPIDPLLGDAIGRDGAVDKIRRPPTCAVFNLFGRHTDTSARLFLLGRLDCHNLLFPGRRRFPIRRFSPKIGRIGGAALGLRAISEPPPGFRRMLSE
jgi:hypothetical protein